MTRHLLPLLIAPVLATGCITEHVITEHAMAHEKTTVVEGRPTGGFPLRSNCKTESVPGQPAYYALVPFTAVADVATLPIQLSFFVFLRIVHLDHDFYFDFHDFAA